MSAEWAEMELGDFLELKRGYDLPKNCRNEGTVPIISSSGESGSHDVSKVKGPGVVTGRYGTIGEVYFIERDFWPLNTTLYVRNFKGNDPLFAYYFLKTVSFSDYSDKAAVPGVNRNHLHKAKIRVPIDPEEQKNIAIKLWTLDKKIELNRQINQTLEQIAKTIFKSWFVDFEPVKAKIEAKAAGRDPERAAMCAISGKTEAELDQLFPEQYQQLAATAALFPAELVESNLGVIPAGWEVGTLKDLTVKIGSGATPRGGSGVYLDEGTALIRSQNVYDSEFVWDGLVRISDSAAKQLGGVEVKQEDVLLNITGASILRTCVVIPDVLPARVNQHVAIIRSKLGIPSRYLHQHLLQQCTKDYLMGLNAGASREAVTKGHIESVPILKPSPEILACFDEATSSVFSEIEQLASQSRTLATIRDTLLPKLLSGELPVKSMQSE